MGKLKVDDGYLDRQREFVVWREDLLTALGLLRGGKRRDVWEVDLLNFLVENVGEVDRFRDGWPFGWNIDRRCKK